MALGIALGWALYRVAAGVRAIVSTLLTDYPEPSELFNMTEGAGLTWVVGERILSLGPLVYGLIEFGVVLLAALLVMRYRGATR